METMKKANEAVQRFFSRYGKTAATLLVFLGYHQHFVQK